MAPGRLKVGQVAPGMAPRAPGHPKRGRGWAEGPQAAAARPQLTLISICSSISLFLMAAYSFSSLRGTRGRAGTLGRGQAPTVRPRGCPSGQEPVLTSSSSWGCT